MEDQRQLRDGRHLTPGQREEIVAGLEGSVTGPVSIKAAAADKEAVGYEAEIASVLADVGCEVEIENATSRASVQELPIGLELTIKEKTVRPGHAYRIFDAFRRAGVTVATKINGRRRKNDTLYITIGPDDAT